MWKVIKETELENIPEPIRHCDQWLILAADDFPLAILTVERDNFGLFEVVFPLDEDDVRKALCMLRQTSGVTEPIFVRQKILHEDTGLPMLDEAPDCWFKRYLLGDTDEDS